MSESDALEMELEPLATATSLLTRAAEDWRIHVGCVERANAARPAILATKAERALYQERYRAMEDARREHLGSAIALAKWLGENGNLPAIVKALSPPPPAVGGEVEQLRAAVAEVRCKARLVIGGGAASPQGGPNV